MSIAKWLGRNAICRPRCALFVGGFTALIASAASPSWESDIQAFEQATLRQSPPQGAVVLYGSSSFRMWTNAAEAFPNQVVINRGFGGSQLSDLIEYSDRVIVPLHPRILLIYGGDNDLAANKTPEQVEADFRELVRRVHRRLPRTRIGFLAIKPSPSREQLLPQQKEANARVERFARKVRRVDYLDVATPLFNADHRPDPRFFLPDRLHLNGDGYARWREVLQPYLRR